jgi:hypothetical protein
MAAARPVFNLGSQQPQSLVISILAAQALAAFADHTLKFIMPCKAKILGMRLNVGLVGGTHVTSTLDVTKGGTTMLAAPFDVATAVAGTPIDKEIAALAANAAVVAANSELAVAIVEDGGTNPTWADVTLQIDYQPLGG